MYRLNKPPSYFWIIAVSALIWNLLGVIAYLTQVYTPDLLKASMTEEQIELFDSTPSFINGAFAIAVWAGFLASIFLLMRKTLAHFIFLVSLVGVVLQLGYHLFFTASFEVYGAKGFITPFITLGISVFLIVFSKRAIQKQWLV